MIVSFALAALAACRDDGALDSDVPIAAATEEVFVAGDGASGEEWVLFSRISSLAFTMSGDPRRQCGGRRLGGPHLGRAFGQRRPFRRTNRRLWRRRPLRGHAARKTASAYRRRSDPMG